MSAIAQPLNSLSGVGPKLEDKLNALGIYNLTDLLFHLPLRYEDRTRVTPIAQTRLNQNHVVEGRVLGSQVVFGKRRSLLVNIEDDSGALQIRMFHFSKAQQKAFENGRQIRCFGEIRQGRSGPEMVHPEYRLDPLSEELPDTLTPIYPSTEGFTQHTWRKLQEQAVVKLEKSAEFDSLIEMPAELANLDISVREALLYLHRPPKGTDLHAIEQGTHPFQQRLAYEELLAHQVSMLKARASRRSHKAPRLNSRKLVNALLDSLEFSLTSAQQRTCEEIANDLNMDIPMLRLVQGDVGSGKTVVAALAAAQAVSSGYQVAIMAPTEILAEQHLENFGNWFSALGVSVGWLVGRHTPKQKAEIIDQLQQGHIDIILGTHAVFQDNVFFKNLGLVIIDEQHRFGVHQRLSLRDKGVSELSVPHQLIMTATPIPRTLAMTAYADLDLSVIDELPPGRTPIKTIALEQARRPEVIERIKAACEKKHQAYWVCTLIEESEQLNCQAAEKTAEHLKKELNGLNVAIVHGKQKPSEKAQTMQAFQEGHIDLLVATTVIEVGVNVPNASLMVIENPERLGLAQLHQLRGRVGRGSIESFCVLLYQSPLSKTAKARINIMRESNDGFVIAETDLRLRGPGEVLGTRQTGALMFRIADIERDADLLPVVSGHARRLYESHNESVEKLVARWINQADYYAQG